MTKPHLLKINSHYSLRQWVLSGHFEEEEHDKRKDGEDKWEIQEDPSAELPGWELELKLKVMFFIHTAQHLNSQPLQLKSNCDDAELYGEVPQELDSDWDNSIDPEEDESAAPCIKLGELLRLYTWKIHDGLSAEQPGWE